MSDRYPPGYTPPHKLLPWFVGIAFTFEGMAFAALGIAYQAQKGAVLEPNALPAIGVYLLLTFVGMTLLSAYWVQSAREARTGHGRKQTPDYMRQIAPGVTRIVDPLPIEVAKAERWLRRVATGDSSLSQAGAEEAAGLDREQANAMIGYLEQRGLWAYANGRDNRNGGDWTPGKGGRFISMLRPDARYTPMLDALAIVAGNEPPYSDDDGT